ncbi:PEP-CTERM sorting domain-containing protein [Akkermansiaceae bacterium]|nr:PEP-CTERM sorting domain-containing protein [Akkermansiaceae bacterium]
MRFKLFTAACVIASGSNAYAAEGDTVDFDFSTSPIADGSVYLGSDGETTITFDFQTFGNSPPITSGASGAGTNLSSFNFDADNPGDSAIVTATFSQPLLFDSGIRHVDWQVFNMEWISFGANTTVTEEQNPFKFDVSGSGTSTINSDVTQAGVIDFMTRYHAVYTFDNKISGFSIRASDTTFTHFAGITNDGIQLRWPEGSVTVAPEPSSALLSLIGAVFLMRRRCR